jgi:hypothetical protein
MLPFGMTIPATVPQGSEFPEGLMNNPVYRLSRSRTVSETCQKFLFLDLLEFISYGFLDLSNIRKVESF